MKVSRAVRNGFPSNPMHQVPVAASIDTHSNHNAPAPHEKFAMELIKRLEIDQIHQFMELMSGSNHSYCNRHASAAKMQVQIQNFLTKRTRQFNVDAGDNYEQLMKMLEECDKTKFTYENIGSTVHFCQNIVEDELRTLKNHLLLTEIMPESKRVENFVRPSVDIESEEKPNYPSEQVRQQKQDESEDDITLEQLAFVAKNSQKANIETIAFEQKHSEGLGWKFDAKHFRKTKIETQKQIERVIANSFDNLQGANEIIVVQKAEQVQCEPNYGRNWVYAYDLPYDFNMEDAEEFVHTVGEAYGKIESFRLFPYASMVQKSHKEYRFVLPEELNLSVSFNEDQLSLLRAEEKEPDAGQESRGKHHKLSSTERILRRIESNRKSHLNKSYLLMRFVDYESKQKLLSPDMRLFGWNLSRNLNVRFDDAGEKKTIVVSNISWGTKLGEVESWINDLLDEYGYSNLGCFCAERDKILTKNYVFFTLGSFWESLKVIQILNGQQFNHQTIKVRHVYGSLRAYDNVYTENIRVQTHDYLKARLKTVKQRNRPPSPSR